MKRLTLSLAGLSMVFLCGACGGSGSGTTYGTTSRVVPGTLVVDWTISGHKDPNQCALAQASQIRVTITTPGGSREVGAYEQDCEALATSIDLEPGSYAAEAVLLDPAGNPRTTTVALDQFTLDSGDSLTVPIDFPADSFL